MIIQTRLSHLVRCFNFSPLPATNYNLESLENRDNKWRATDPRNFHTHAAYYFFIEKSFLEREKEEKNPFVSYCNESIRGRIFIRLDTV